MFDKTMNRQLYYASASCSFTLLCGAQIQHILNDLEGVKAYVIERWNSRAETTALRTELASTKETLEESNRLAALCRTEAGAEIARLRTELAEARKERDANANALAVLNSERNSFCNYLDSLPHEGCPVLVGPIQVARWHLDAALADSAAKQAEIERLTALILPVNASKLRRVQTLIHVRYSHDDLSAIDRECLAEVSTIANRVECFGSVIAVATQQRRIAELEGALRLLIGASYRTGEEGYSYDGPSPWETARAALRTAPVATDGAADETKGAKL